MTMLPRYDLTRIRTRLHLTTVLGIDDAHLEHVLGFVPPPDLEPTVEEDDGVVVEMPAFFRHKIPKRNKARGYRIAWEPAFLKPRYKALAGYLGKYFRYRLNAFPHPATFGYVGGRNIKGNAEAHCGHTHLLVVDIEAFFPSITRGRIEALLLDCGFNSEIADLLSRFLTIDGSLPLGLPTSPVVSNAVFLAADIELAALAERCGATYTRYSDDMSFSGNGELPSPDDIDTILAGHGFSLARSKTRRSRRGQAHFVTGLSVSEVDQPHVPKVKKRRLRQELYYAGKFGLADHLTRLGVNDDDVLQEQINRLDGTVKFVAHHEPRLAPRLRHAWGEILKEADAKPSFKPRSQTGETFAIAIDEAEYRSPRGHVLALGLTVSQHQQRVVGLANEVLQEALGNLWAAGDPVAIEKRGLHYNDATPDLRLRYVQQLRVMPFEGYVVMGPLAGPDVYEATYLRLLGAVIRRRLMAAEGKFAGFVVEKNNKVAETKIRALILETVAALKAEKSRGPKAAFVHFVAKPDLHVSVPDFLLGVLGDYLKSVDAKAGKPEGRDRLMFEQIRDKYRLILDVEPWTEYSRRRPISPWTDWA
ncbi:reverse transcriptase family protein [Caulobacter sp.]|uniref:reverse transcriptase family protein n=1 Tax=Caulobacter sp. TaxID=78 RepID=UPI0031E18493